MFRNGMKKAWLAACLMMTVLALMSRPADAALVKTTLQVSNITCVSCLYSIRAELQNVQGVTGMGADLANRLVFVSHLAELAADDIAGVVTDMGYPATVLASEDIPGDTAGGAAEQPFAQQSGGCGGCGSGSGGLARQFRNSGDAATLTTVLAVDSLSCTSCLVTIGDALQELPGAVGMRADLASRLVLVDHDDALSADELAQTVTDAGYPSRVVGSGVYRGASSAFGANPAAAGGNAAGYGGGCGSRVSCNATSRSWSDLYQKFLGQRQ